MPELAETAAAQFTTSVSGGAVFGAGNLAHLPDLLSTSFITNIKVQVETPTLQLCAGNKVRKDTVIDNNGQQKTIVHKPFKSCGSKSLSDKEREFAYPSPTSYMSYLAYDVVCASDVVDVLVDLQDPITSLTPWVFGKIGDTMSYFITAADKSGECTNLFLSAPDCAVPGFENRVRLATENVANL